MCLLVFTDGVPEVEIANAGHLPPLVVREGRAAYLDPGGTLLGIQNRQHGLQTLPCEPGTRLVLMTDGLVERRSEPIGPMMDRLADEVAANDVSAEELCDQLMAGWSGGEDDDCLMVIDVLVSRSGGTPG